MGIKTKIEYVDSSCNPIMGCSPGCELYSSDPAQNHCYAATLINRYAGRKGWPRRFDLPEHFPHRIPQALHWSDLTNIEREGKPWLNGHPRIIFINDLSDGFCPSVDPEEWLLPHLEAIGKSPHTWLLLTKWPKQMRKFCGVHPLPDNMWPGVTMMRQQGEWRVRELLAISASVHWVSCEPLLEGIDLRMPSPDGEELTGSCPNCRDGSYSYHKPERGMRTCTNCGYATYIKRPDWILVGGESGPGARPLHPRWVRDIRDQCLASGIPWFLKQWGTWFPRSQWEGNPNLILPDDCDCIEGPNLKIVDDDIMHRVGKRRAGHLLDGREWHQWPEVAG